VSTPDQPTGAVRTGPRPATGSSPRPAGAGEQGRPPTSGQRPGTTGQRPTGQRPTGQRPAGQRPAAPGQRPPGARPAAKKGGARPAPGAPRRVRLTAARVDPWSVMKLAFLLSVAIGIATVVAAGVLWTVLDGMGVFTDVNDFVARILGAGEFDINDYVGFGKVLSLGTVLAVVNVVLITALCTLGAFLYNVASNLVGGLHLTLSDD
jgi:hypothetical protein